MRWGRCAGRGACCSVEHCRQTAHLEPKRFAARHRSSIATGHPASPECRDVHRWPQPATAPTASAVDAPNLGTSGGTLDPGVLEALRAAVRQVRAALATAPSSSNTPTGDSTAPAAPGTASSENSARGSSGTYEEARHCCATAGSSKLATNGHAFRAAGRGGRLAGCTPQYAS